MNAPQPAPASSPRATVLRTLRSLVPKPRTRLLHAAPALAGGLVPYIGMGVRYGSEGPEVIRALHHKHGDVFAVRLAGKRFTFGFDPEFVKFLYTAPHYKVAFFEGLKQFRGFGSVIRFEATGPEGSNVGLDVLRRYLPPRVRQTTPALDQETRQVLAQLAQRGRLELRRDFSAVLVQLTAMLLTGPRLARSERFLSDMAAFDLATHAMASSIFSQAPLQAAAEVRDRLIATLSEELDRRRAGGPLDPPDLLDAMLVSGGADGQPFTNAQICDELIGYLFGTTANTPAAATMCMLQILTHPDIRARVEAELTEVLAASGDVLDDAALRRLTFMGACLDETLRLWTSGIHLRQLMVPAQIGPYTVPAGELIATSPYVLHRDPAVFTDPDVFDPDRFIKGPRLPASRPPQTHFVPWGKGVHSCMGRALARNEIKLLISRMLTDLAPELVEPARPLGVDWKTAGFGTPDQPVEVAVTVSGSRTR